MNPLLALPDWNRLHPAMVHCSVALLRVASVFVLWGAFLEREKGRIFLLGALILMTLGTAATFLARSTGEAATQRVERTPAIAARIDQHEELAETSSPVFLALTAIFAALVYGLHRLQQTRAIVLARLLPLVFLLLYGAGAALLVDTAHRGGRLVHEFGIRALLPPQVSPVAAVRPQPEK